MVESKLEALVNRLEIAVARAEGMSGGQGSAAQSSSGGSGGCPLAKSYAAIVTPLIEACRGKTAALGNTYVTDMTSTFLQLVIAQGQVLTTMNRFAKPADTQFLFALNQAAFTAGESVKRDRKSPVNHVSVLLDAQALFNYPAFEEAKALIDNTGEYLDMIPFNGNKILKANVEKDIEWYRSVQDICIAIKEFICENCQVINKWQGSEDGSGAAAYFESATTADKLNDFSSLQGGASSAPAQAKSSAPVSSGPAGALAAELLTLTKPQLDQLKAAAATIGNATVIQASDFIVESVSLNAALLSTMAAFRKPADLSFCTTGSKVVQMMATVEEAGKKDRKSPMDVMKVCTDGFQLFLWNTTPGNDLLKDYLSEIESQVLFYGNRIRKKGNEAEQAWFEAYNGMMQALTKFVGDRRETICDWRGTQDGAGAAAFYASQASASSSGSIATRAPEEEKKQAAAPVKAAPAKAAAGAKAPAKQVKELRGNKWVIENFTGETIRFDDPDEINKRVSFEFFNCNKCKIEMVGKCQNISVQSCKGTTIETDKVVSQIEAFKCQAFNIRAINQLPMAAIEGCNQVHIYLTNATLNCKISSSCTRSTIVHFPKEGVTDDQLVDEENYQTSAVPEVFTTTVQSQKLITEGYMEED